MARGNTCTGRIARVIWDRGFGFIAPDGGGDDLWFHASIVRDVNFKDLNEGDRVTFAVAPTVDSFGRERCAFVRPAR